MSRFAAAGLVSLCVIPVLCAVAGDEPPPVFDGQSLANWTTLDGQPVTGGWEVVDGTIHLRKQQKRSGHIVTQAEYGDFVLTFDWKIASGGNSGLKYRVRQYGNKTLGCEYQIYDDTASRKQLPSNKRSGSLYDLYAPHAGGFLNPPGEFNSAKIVVQGNCLEHWLNGRRIVCAAVGSDDWQRRVADSKFADVPGFAESPRGKIMLTDHGSEVWFRNLTLRPLTAGSHPAGTTPASAK